MDEAEAWLRQQSMPHLDSVNGKVQYAPHTFDFLDDPEKPIISANAYLGSRAIVKGLEQGADIIICETIGIVRKLTANSTQADALRMLLQSLVLVSGGMGGQRRTSTSSQAP